VSKEEILDIGEFQTSNDWQLKMTRQDFDPQDVDVKSLIAFCECIEATEAALKITNKFDKIANLDQCLTESMYTIRGILRGQPKKKPKSFARLPHIIFFY
jgi:hypothetical protein